MRYRLLMAVTAAAASADLLTKATASVLAARTPVHLPGNWVLSVVHNNGIIFGVGAGTRLPTVSTVIAVVLLTVLLLINRRESGRPWAVTIGLLLAAAIGNLGESRLSGYVVDWIHPPRMALAFNLADVAAVSGMVLLMVLSVSALLSRSQVRP